MTTGQQQLMDAISVTFDKLIQSMKENGQNTDGVTDIRDDYEDWKDDQD